MAQNINKNEEKIPESDENIKEEFCGACVAIPFAFAGVGASFYGSNSSRKAYKTQKQVSFWGGVISTIISIIIAVYFLLKKCKECGYKDE